MTLYHKPAGSAVHKCKSPKVSIHTTANSKLLYFFLTIEGTQSFDPEFLSPQMKRDIAALEREEFDVVIIGAGINGAAAAFDAALRGLKTALVDKADFGSKTSSGCFKIAHGGIRYLQHLDFGRLFESVEEQRLLRINAPHLLRPLPFLIPCYKKLMQRKSVLRFAMLFYEALTSGRNRDVSPELALLPHRSLSREETLGFAPSLRQDGLSGGLIYYDTQMNNVDRLTLDVVKSAADAGAVIANYVELLGAICAEGSVSTTQESRSATITGIKVKDTLSGKQFLISGRYFVNATGPWIDLLTRRMQSGSGVATDNAASAQGVYSKGIQIALPELTRTAVAVESSYADHSAKLARGSRSYFMQPWQSRTLIGTSDSLYRGDPDEYRIHSDEVESFLTEIRSAYPDPRITIENVSHAFGGLRPVDASQLEAEEGAAKVAKTDRVESHDDYCRREGNCGKTTLENLALVRGVKYTTFRALAERTVDLAAAFLGKINSSTPGECRTRETRLYSTPDLSLSRYQQHLIASGLSSEQSRFLASNFGSEAEKVLAYAESYSRNSDSGINHILAGQTLLAIREEMAQSLVDIVLRRLPLGATGYRAEAVEQIADLAAGELNWSKEERERQIGLVRTVYSRFHYLPESSRSY